MPGKIIFSTEPENYYYMDINVPCQVACPAATNIPAYIRSLFEECYGRSYEINHLANILPGVLGRICSRPCEDKCRHGEPELGRPINICHIKRAAADLRKEGTVPKERPFGSLGIKVAIVGSGPAGLAAAHDLSTIGVSVNIYEALDKPGGMLRYGIPEFRLPRHILDAEINHILEAGVVLNTGTRVGTDVAIEDLLQTYDAVLLAAGCYKSLPLNVPGEALLGIFPGLEFMMDVCAGRPPTVGNKVLVIGAGFTAFDCARSALRLGAEEVAICLRRTEEDLAVSSDEVLETKREGVKINSLMLSRRVIGDEKVEAVEFVRTQPGERRADGKREVAPIKGSAFTLGADSVIVAVGQRPEPMEPTGEKNHQGLLTADKDSLRTSVKGLYLAGDYMTGPSTVIEAIGMGRRAAEKIVEEITGKLFRQKVVRMEDTAITDRERAWDFLPRQEIPTVQPVQERFKAPSLEVETGFSMEQAKEESKRCYLCYLHYEIDISRCIYCRYCIDVAPRDCIKLVEEIKTNEMGAITGFVETSSWQDVQAIVIDNSRCIRCGECMRVCPVECISVTRVELMERMLQEGNANE
ncbi:MAG: FAD-dependent oxidoreductase [Desulfobacteraceae bacterium]|jgi:formate dehydrogenase major subunit